MQAKNSIMTVIGAATQNTLKPVNAGLSIVGAGPKSLYSTEKHAFIAGLVTAAAGAFLWKKHRVLGGLVGFASGDALYTLVKEPEQRATAFVALAATSAAAYASLKWKKHPALGYIGASVAASILAEPLAKHLR